MTVRVFTCRACRGDGGKACSKHRARGGFDRKCADTFGYRTCEPCYCCRGAGDHLGGVCAKDLRGAEA